MFRFYSTMINKEPPARSTPSKTSSMPLVLQATTAFCIALAAGQAEARHDTGEADQEVAASANTTGNVESEEQAHLRWLAEAQEEWQEFRLMIQQIMVDVIKSEEHGAAWQPRQNTQMLHPPVKPEKGVNLRRGQHR